MLGGGGGGRWFFPPTDCCLVAHGLQTLIECVVFLDPKVMGCRFAQNFGGISGFSKKDVQETKAKKDLG